jgi:hypothetical protein
VVQDADSELIVQALTTSGNVPDGSALPALAQPQAKGLTGDKAYDSKTNRSHLTTLGVGSGLYPRVPRPGRPRKSWQERPKIERKFARLSHGFPSSSPWNNDHAGIDAATRKKFKIGFGEFPQLWRTAPWPRGRITVPGPGRPV